MASATDKCLGHELGAIFVESSHTSRSNARTGIQSVVRGLVYGLVADGRQVVAVRWSFRNRSLTPLKAHWERSLGLPGNLGPFLPVRSLARPHAWPVWLGNRGLHHRTPLRLHPTYQPRLAGSWLLMPELMEGHHLNQVADHARSSGMKVASIFHDAIPWHHPELVRHWTRDQHAAYMQALCGLNAILPVSQHSANHFAEFAASVGQTTPLVRVCPLPAEVPGQPRCTTTKHPRTGPVRILCVSTLEPRKNHARILAAFEWAQSRLPTTPMELHLAGAPYPAVPDIANAVRAMTLRNPSIFWHESVAPTDLHKLYEGCDFTIFGSEIEGFGLPVLESLWFGKPCVCSDQGAIGENARGGGCLTTTTSDLCSLTDAVVRMSSDPSLRHRLALEATSRPLSTWREYASAVISNLP